MYWQHGKTPEEKEQTTNQIDHSCPFLPSPSPPAARHPAARLRMPNQNDAIRPRLLGTATKRFLLCEAIGYSGSCLIERKYNIFFPFGCCSRAVDVECGGRGSGDGEGRTVVVLLLLLGEPARPRAGGRWTRCRVESAVRS